MQKSLIIQGILLIDCFGLGLIIMVLNLVRGGKLSPSYGVFWIVSMIGMITTVSVPTLLAFATSAVGAVFPASALSLMGFFFILLMLIFITVKLSTLSARQIELIQAVGLSESLGREARWDAKQEGNAENNPKPVEPEPPSC